MRRPWAPWPPIWKALTRPMATIAQQQQLAPPAAERPKTDDALKQVWFDGTGLRAWFSTVQNGPIVYRFMTTVFGFFLLGGAEALLMRTQLAVPENTFITPDLYN